MKAIINGDRSLVKLAKGADEVLRVMVTNDDGSAIDVTGDTVDLVVYDRSDRANAAVATHAGDTLTTPTAGYATFAIADTELTYGPGDYFIFVKWTDVSATKVYLSEPFSLSVY